jgi:hypothetical protein
MNNPYPCRPWRRTLWALVFLLLGLASRSQAQVYFLTTDASINLNAADALNRLDVSNGTSATLLSSITPSPLLLAIDRAGSRAFVYEGVATNRTIKVFNNITGTPTQAAYTLAVPAQVAAIEYDPTGDYVYFLTTDANATSQSASDSFYRIKADGSMTTAETLLSAFTTSPSYLTLDIANNRAFVYEGLAAARGIKTIDLLNKTVGPSTIAVPAQVVALDYSPLNGYIYYLTTDGVGNTGTATPTDALYRTLPDGTDNNSVITSFINSPAYMTLDLANNRIYVADNFGSSRSFKVVQTTNGTAGQVLNSYSQATQLTAIELGQAAASTTVTSITTTTTSPTNASSITYTVTFAASVTGLTNNNFSLSPTVAGASIGQPAVVSGSNNTQYTVTVSTGGSTSNGTLQLNLANDNNLTPGLSNDPFAGPAITIDKTAPTVTISSTGNTNNGTTTTTPIPFTVTFTETVTGFQASDVMVTGGTLSGFAASGATYTFNVTPSSGSSTVTVNVAANVATDAAGNSNTAAAPFSITYQQRPTAVAQNVTLNLDANGNATLNASNVNNGSTGGGTLTYTIQKIAFGYIPESTTPLTLTTPNGANFTQIRFASYGTPNNNANGNYTLGSCNAANSLAAAQNAYVGRSTGSLYASNTDTRNNPVLGDPCGGTPKALAVQAAYSADAASLTYTCTEAGKTQYVLLTVTSSAGTSTSVAQVTVNPSPTATISSVSPTSAQRGTPVTVAGTNLSGVSSVTVNGAAATVSSLSSTGFTFMVPNTAPFGPGSLVVTTPCAQTLTNTFNVTAPALTATVSTTSASPTSTAPIPFSVSFSQSVGSTFTAADVTVSGGTITSGSFSGSSAGPYTFTVTPSGLGTVTVSLAANVAQDTNNTGNSASNTVSVQFQAPTIVVAPASLPIGQQGQLYSQALSASGGTAPYSYAITAGALPSGLSLTNGTLSGTPANSGTFNFTVTATDASAYSGSRSYTLVINTQPTTAAPVITTPANGSFSNNRSVTATGTAPAGSIVSIYIGVNLAGTTSASAAGAFSFAIPGNAPDGTFTISATAQSSGATVSPSSNVNTFTIDGTAPNATLSSSVASGGSTTTTPVSFTATFNEPVTGLTAAGLTVTNGTVTSGPTAGANNTYTFQVTPRTAGTVTVQVAANAAQDRATNGNTASAPYSFTFAAPTIAVAPASLPQGTQGTAYSQALSATGGTAPYSYAITAGALPAGLTLTNGTIAGTPTVNGTFNFTVTATDASAAPGPYSGSRSYTLAINAQPTTAAPVVTAPANGSFSNNRSVTATGTAPAGSIVSIYIGNNLAGTISASASGTFSYLIPGTAPDGTYTVSATAQSSGATASASSNVNTFTIDGTAPTASLTSAVPNNGTTTTSPVSFTATFNEPVTGLTAVGLTVTNGTVTSGPTAGSGNTYTFQVTPSAAGTVTVQVAANAAQDRATNGNTASALYSLTFVAPTITVAPASLNNGQQGVAYSQALSATGGTAPYTYAITAGALPAGLSLANGTIAGTPTVNGTFNFTVTATDASTVPGPYSGSQAYTLVIAAPAITATTWTGTISTDWFTAGNWTQGVPNATIDATIPTAPSGGRFPNISAGTATVRNLTFNSGATLNQSGGTLAIAANLTNNGTFLPTGGTVNLGTTAFSNIFGASSIRFWNLTVGTSGAQLSTSIGASIQRLLSINGSFSTNGNSLVLESNNTLTALVVNNNSSVVTGTVTVQRAIDPSVNPGLGYRHYSSPVSNSTVGDLATSGFTPVVNPAFNTDAMPYSITPYPTVYGYDDSRLSLTNNLDMFDKGYFSPSALSDPLAVGKGYTVNIGASEVVDFQGTLNNGDLSLNLTSTRNTYPEGGWQFLGNPYPAPLDYSRVAAADRAGLESAIYVFSSTSQYMGRYRVYINGIGNPVVPLGQGFFTRVASGNTTATMTFRNSQRLTVPNGTTLQRTTADPRPLVQLTLQSQGAAPADETYVYFENGATTGFEPAFDAEKLPNPTGFNLSTTQAGKQLSIDGQPELGTAQRVVPLAVGVPAAGVYTFTASQLLNLSATPVYLRDLQLGTLTDLRQQPTYQFTVSNASALNTTRFALVFSPQQALATVPAALAEQVGLYPNPARTQVAIELPLSLSRQPVTAALLDALGRVVRTQVLPAGLATHAMPLADLASGMYSLRLATDKGMVVKKLVIE